jgi:hypothetical protein
VALSAKMVEEDAVRDGLRWPEADDMASLLSPLRPLLEISLDPSASPMLIVHEGLAKRVEW